jgi:hypothetical protein
MQEENFIKYVYAPGKKNDMNLRRLHHIARETG